MQRYGTDRATGHWHLQWSHFQSPPHWNVWLQWPEVAKGLRRIVLRDRSIIRHVREALASAIRFGRQRLLVREELATNALERAILWIYSAGHQRSMDERVRRAVDRLASNLTEPFSLSRLAAECGLSVLRHAHLFRDEVGLSPQQYLEDLRLQRAAQPLRSTGLRVGEIAAEIGYANAFYFTNRFRRRFGRSPSDFRRHSGIALDGPVPV